MRSFLLLPAVALLTAAQSINPTCARDNCLRAVIASNAKPGPASASQDCSSFFKNTVTPATVIATATAFTTVTAPVVTQTNTATSTLSVTTTVSTVGVFGKRVAEASGPLNHALPLSALNTLVVRQQTVKPSSVPTYASACSGTVRYSSACSCIGVTRSTTTVAAPTSIRTSISTITVTPTTTVTATSTLTSTIQATATATCSSFYLQAQGSTVNGQYAVLPGTNDETITSFTPSANNAAVFSIDASGYLYNNGYRANTDTASPATIFFDTPGTFPGSPALRCTRNGRAFSCTGYQSDATLFQLCPSGCSTGSEPCGGVALGTSVDGRCQALSFNAVPAC